MQEWPLQGAGVVASFRCAPLYRKPARRPAKFLGIFSDPRPRDRKMARPRPGLRQEAMLEER
jgi:hypothetical protein